MKKAYVVGGTINYANWMNAIVVSKMEEADFVVFTGGEDVSPSLYLLPEKQHKLTSNNIHRDIEEIKEYEYALELKKPMVGICRGSQLLCVLNGGRLVQHQENPKSRHYIKTWDNQEFEITSSHHQAAYPFNLPDENYQILGWTEGMLPKHEDGSGEEMYPPVECEIVYYPTNKCLGIQGHPEWMAVSEPAVKYLRNTLNDFLEGKLNIHENKDQTIC